MQVDSNMSTGGVNGPTGPRRTGATDKTTSKGLAVKKTAEGASFSSAAGLEEALQATPDVRSAAVDRARSLVNDAQYPPPETVKQLSSFLASKLSPPAE
jgi:hypothetical protein